MLIQFLGTVFFIVMVLVGFWGIIFLSNMMIIWVTGGPPETYGFINKLIGEDTVRRKPLNMQNGIKVLYQRDHKV